MKVKVEITLDVPADIKVPGSWTIKQAVSDYTSHWLEEGYYCGDYQVSLPGGIEYEGFELEFEKQA